jgi:hypothetical protein
MKKFGFFVASLVMALFLFAGCDFIRSSLGKPTSADLARIRQEKEAREQFLRDSVAAVRAEEARLAAEADSIAAQQAAFASELKKYYAVAGAFKSPEGAQSYVEKLQEKGLRVHLFDFRSGLKVVCLEGHDTLEEARRDVATLRELHLSDSDPWIYNTKQKLHII